MGRKVDKLVCLIKKNRLENNFCYQNIKGCCLLFIFLLIKKKKNIYWHFINNKSKYKEILVGLVSINESRHGEIFIGLFFINGDRQREMLQMRCDNLRQRKKVSVYSFCLIKSIVNGDMHKQNVFKLKYKVLNSVNWASVWRIQ